MSPTAHAGAAGEAAVPNPSPNVTIFDPSVLNDPGPRADRWRACILLVEDDETVLDTFARMLRLEGYDVLTSAHPEDGLEEAQNNRPDAIILDFRMPLLDGLGFLRQLRALPYQRTTPVAIVTGDYFLDDHITRELHELGAEVCFKPMWLEQLVDLARKLIAQHGEQRHSA